jgi:23S rRNA pseudouridine1911/1915/1917 synthase
MRSNPQSQRGAQRQDAKLEVKEPGELMKFLIQNLTGKSRDNIKSMLKENQIVVDGVAVRQFNHPLEVGQIVEVRSEKAPDSKAFKGITILFEDAHLIVIDKHAGMLSIATDYDNGGMTAYNMLSHHVKIADINAKIFVVHRLDRDTSGLMMFAKSEEVKHALQDDWQNAVSERTYAALVEGKPKEPKGTLKSYLWEGHNLKIFSGQDASRGQLAITHYELTKSNGQYSLLKVNLETGRKNQIRVHMEELGHPVVGDKKYGARGNPIARLGLHAQVLAFTHPVTGKAMRFETNVPRKFLRLI